MPPENAQRLVPLAAPRVVDDEARRVFRAHRPVPAAQSERDRASPTQGAVERPSTTSTTFSAARDWKK